MRLARRLDWVVLRLTWHVASSSSFLLRTWSFGEEYYQFCQSDSTLWSMRSAKGNWELAFFSCIWRIRRKCFLFPLLRTVGNTASPNKSGKRLALIIFRLCLFSSLSLSLFGEVCTKWRSFLLLSHPSPLELPVDENVKWLQIQQKHSGISFVQCSRVVLHYRCNQRCWSCLFDWFWYRCTRLTAINSRFLMPAQKKLSPLFLFFPAKWR